MKPLILYHGHCIDGFTAAWSCWRKWYADAEYVPLDYGKLEAIPDVTGREVFMVDFCVPRALLAELHAKAASFTVLDHHATAQADCDGLAYCKFDMTRSGAGITWDELIGPDRPWLVDYVEDRDLWRFALPQSKAVNAYVGSIEHTFKAWDKLFKLSLNVAATRGGYILGHVQRYVNEMAAQARPTTCNGHKALVINAPYVGISELLGHLAQQTEVAIGWYQRQDGAYQYSLRSTTVDVSAIAKGFGGGGHKAAAGFVVHGERPF